MADFPYSIDDGLLGERLRLHANVEMTVRILLDHENAEHIFLGVDEKIRAVGAAPAVAPQRTEHAALTHVGEHAETQAETISGQIRPDRPIADGIRRHQLHRLPAEQARAVKRSV